MTSIIERVDQVRAWKDEDYRERLGTELLDHPAGDIDLSPAGSLHPHLSVGPPLTTFTCGDTFCQSLADNCFSFEPMICSAWICKAELAESRY